MKKMTCSIMAIFALFFNSSLPVLMAESILPAAESEPEISMDFQDASLKDLLKIFSIQSGLNFIASEGVQDRRITLYLDKVPLSKAMDRLFKANNLSYEFDKGSNIFVVKDWGQIRVELTTRVFNLKYASVDSSAILQEKGSLTSSSSGSSSSSSVSGSGNTGSSGSKDSVTITGITSVVKKLISSDGTVIEDARTNSLIVSDTPNRIEMITQVIASLDVPVPQVLLEVEMLDVSKNTTDKMGVNWPETLLSLDFTGAKKMTSFPFGHKGQNPLDWEIEPKAATPSGFEFGPWNASKFGPVIFSVLNAELTLDFLRSQSDTKSLARPKILTLNNETAEIKITTQEAIGGMSASASTGTSTSSSSSASEAERFETGVSLRVTPQINLETGEITMFVNPRVAETQESPITITGSLGTATFRDPEERSTKSMVRVKDGETIIIGGLIRNDVTGTSSKLPFLGDIPLIGALFRHKGGDNDRNRERELLVFITPHIIKDNEIKISRTKAVIPEREQSVFSGVNRDITVASMLNTLEKKY